MGNEFASVGGLNRKEGTKSKTRGGGILNGRTHIIKFDERARK